MLGAEFHDTEVVCLRCFAPQTIWSTKISRLCPDIHSQFNPGYTRSCAVKGQHFPSSRLCPTFVSSGTLLLGLALREWIRWRNWSGSELTWQKKKRKGLFSGDLFLQTLALVQGKRWKRTVAAKGRTASSSGSTDLRQVELIRETGRKPQVPLSRAQEDASDAIHTALPGHPGYIWAAATVATVACVATHQLASGRAAPGG